MKQEESEVVSSKSSSLSGTKALRVMGSEDLLMQAIFSHYDNGCWFTGIGFEISDSAMARSRRQSLR
jgi:hypothetical protein